MFAILRDWTTRANRLKAAAFNGPASGTVRGSWLSDLAALKKAVMLCWQCQPKWKPEKHGYARRMVGPGYREARGECDGCGAANELCAMYLPKERH
jgi:hypothetical protein